MRYFIAHALPALISISCRTTSSCPVEGIKDGGQALSRRELEQILTCIRRPVTPSQSSIHFTFYMTPDLPQERRVTSVAFFHAPELAAFCDAIKCIAEPDRKAFMFNKRASTEERSNVRLTFTFVRNLC